MLVEADEPIMNQRHSRGDSVMGVGAITVCPVFHNLSSSKVKVVLGYIPNEMGSCVDGVRSIVTELCVYFILLWPLDIYIIWVFCIYSILPAWCLGTRMLRLTQVLAWWPLVSDV